ncbi:MAG: endonuclease/exonuclease/phosphatase family protein [Bacteroidales bacterium]|jgi:maltose 6'-phosphate phosphatase|nr:endonuclease/exonuclease/phosphatase family protein [Bacteroidales bacterium]
MKTLNIFKTTIRLFAIQTILFLFIGCSGGITVNKTPNPDIDYNVNGLEITISGKIIDSDGTITKINIDWDDNNISNLLYGDLETLEESHTYSEPGTYNITITAFDNEGDFGTQSFTAVINYAQVNIDNIKESMFKTSDNEYLILTINLHTYQESQQNEKFNMLMEVIGKMDIDFIAFQECAQHKLSTITNGIIREDNMALIISNRLQENYNVNYNFTWNWAHYGWDVWEEGIAILSKYPIIDSDNKYISTSESTSNITSRKAIYASYEIPEGKINIFSTHTHWRTSETDEEQNEQIRNIQQMVNEKEILNPITATFVCGDFNVNPTSDYPWSEGYSTMINNGEYIDTFLEIYSEANNKPAQSIYNTIGGTYPGRIDYIFMKNNNNFNIIDSQIIFTDNVVGKISDHAGVLTKIKYIN